MEPFTRRQFLGTAGVVAGVSLPWGLGIAGTLGTAAPEGMAFQRQVPVTQAFEVVVCGGGPAGVAAALAARRAGLKVLLLEAQGQLGGTSTSGLVSHWLGGRTNDGQRWAVGGIFRELVETAVAQGIALLPKPVSGRKYQPHGWLAGQLAVGIPFDPFGMARLLDAKLLEAGVEVALLTTVFDVEQTGGRITHLLTLNKSGLAAVPTRAVIDATGDADLAARSGCEFVLGREEDHLMTPASLTFHVDQVDQDALAEYIELHDAPRLRQEIAALRQQGEWPFPYEIFISVQLDQKGTMMINTTRLVGVDGTDGASKSAALRAGRAEIEQLLAIMRKHFPGFSQARLKAVAPMLGVRETRRIQGAYRLSVADLLAGKEFTDTIGFSAYGWDLPNPQRPSDNPGHGTMPELTPLPYRILVPGKLDNLICPGRAVSVERPVLGPLRVMAPCMAMGQAAGLAAAQVVRQDGSFAQVEVSALRTQLADAGAVITPPSGRAS